MQENLDQDAELQLKSGENIEVLNCACVSFAMHKKVPLISENYGFYEIGEWRFCHGRNVNLGVESNCLVGYI